MLLVVLFLGMLPSPFQLSPHSSESFEQKERERNRSELAFYISTVKKCDTIIANTKKAIVLLDAILEKNDSIEAKGMMVDLKSILASNIKSRKWAQDHVDQLRNLLQQ